MLTGQHGWRTTIARFHEQQSTINHRVVSSLLVCWWMIFLKEPSHMFIYYTVCNIACNIWCIFCIWAISVASRVFTNFRILEISNISFFFKFRILFESGKNFAKIIEISLLQECVSIPYRYINSASLKLFFFSYQCQCSEGLPWRRGGSLWGHGGSLELWRLPLEPFKLTWILECSPWSLSCSPWGHMEGHPGLVQVYNGAVEVCLGALEARPGALGTHPGAVESHSGAIEAGALHVHPKETPCLTLVHRGSP